MKHLPLMLTNSDNRHLRRCTCFSRIFFRRLFNLINHNQRSSHISARKLELDLIRYFSTKKNDRFLCRFNFRLRFFCLIRNEFTVFFYIRNLIPVYQKPPAKTSIVFVKNPVKSVESAEMQFSVEFPENLRRFRYR